MVIYQYPFKKYVLGTKFGIKGDSWSCGYHSGLDLKSRNYGGDGVIYPIAAGTVESISAHGKSYGNHVVIKHADGYLSLYAHLASISVTKGQAVKLTTKLGIEGTTGNSTGVHLHMEIHKGSYSYPASINPQTFLDKSIAAQKEAADLEIKKQVVYVDNKAVTLEAVYQDGTNYVKLRDIATALGATVNYTAATNRIDIKK